MKNLIILFSFTFIISIHLMAQTIMNIHQNNGTVLQIPTSTIDSITYTNPNPGNLAAITTSNISSITGSTAVSGGNISNNGGSLVTQKGICWSTSPNPTTANNITNDGSGSGSYTSNLTGLTANTTYYVRAYAINSAGIAYGNEVSFINAGRITALDCSSFTSNGTLTAGTAAIGISCIVPYTGGNGGTYNGQMLNSIGVTGLFATLSSGNFANGSGTLNYTITGTPSSGGTARFFLNIGGQYCDLILTVSIVSNLGQGVTYNGYTYSTIVLGNGQEWMAENLRTTFYANGDPIPNVSDSLQWNNLTTGGWVHYNNDIQYENLYGKLYNGYAASDVRNVCPSGWHVPTDSEWNTLIYYLYQNTGYNSNLAGEKMKSTSGWYLSGNGSNESGFSGLPGGNRSYDGRFRNFGTAGLWWSSTVNSSIGIPNISYYRLLQYSDPIATSGSFNNGMGSSIRCLKD